MNHFLTQILLVGFSFLLYGLLPGQVFEEDFERYAVGEVAGWDASSGSVVLDAETSGLMGSPNQFMELGSASIKLLKEVQNIAEGGVTTYAMDFVEMSGAAASSGVQVGFGQNNELNTDNAAVRVSLSAVI